MTLETILSVLLGASVVLIARTLYGLITDGSRNAARANVRCSELESKLNQYVGAVDQLRGRTMSAGAVSDLNTRLTALEKNVAQMDLEVLDVAEKVAARLSDRERKRRDREQPEEDEEDEAQMMARARAAFPLPSLFPPETS